MVGEEEGEEEEMHREMFLVESGPRQLVTEVADHRQERRAGEDIDEWMTF